MKFLLWQVFKQRLDKSAREEEGTEDALRAGIGLRDHLRFLTDQFLSDLMTRAENTMIFYSIDCLEIGGLVWSFFGFLVLFFFYFSNNTLSKRVLCIES